MKSMIVAQVRKFLSRLIGEDDTATNTSFKRDRFDDELSSDDGNNSVKRKKLGNTSYPGIFDIKDMWNEEEKDKNVRYVPIHVEAGQPSTSTPNEVPLRLGSLLRTVPMKLSESCSNGPSTPSRNTRVLTSVPIKPTVNAVAEEDDEDDQEIILVETKPPTRKLSKVYKAINCDNDDEDDVIFIKEVPSPPKPSYYISNNERKDSVGDNGVKYYKICRNMNERSASNSPRDKLKGLSGISKAYRRPTPLSRWMQPQRPTGSQSRSRFTTLNGNARSTLAEVFNLDEKRSYQELIKKVADSMNPAATGKPLDIVNIAEDSAAFRLTQRAQRNALNEIKLVEKGLSIEKELVDAKEYDPITVASINSSDSEVEVVPSESSTSSSVRIDRINTLRDSFKDKAITSSDWLLKLNSKYRKKNRATQEKLVDARRESDIISKVNYEQKLAHLEHKLKHELSIPESLIEEPQPTVELPPLTSEQEKLVKKALGPGPPGQLLVEKFNLRLHRRDLMTLAGLNWLNDEVINFYMNLLMQRSADRKDLPKVYATNTFFYPKLMQSGQAGLRRWTRKVDIFAHDLMVVPVHLGVHWCLSLVDFQERRVSYLDSMGGRNQACLDALLQYLRDEHRDKRGEPFDDSGWLTENLKDIPQQMNGSDCGMFACTFAEFSSRGAPYTFTQAHMPYLRRKAALEILQGRLLL